MTRLLFVGDGPRDESVVPRLVETITGAQIDGLFRPWASFVQLKGYKRKLRLAVLAAQDAGASGVVATVDCDSDAAREKMKKLIQGRAEDRTANAPFPTALGEADPHLEAWLIDDPVAVREALRLPADFSISTVRKVPHPKNYLNDLFNSQHREETTIDLLAAIAQRLIPDRCQHAKETGFARFADEINSEISAAV